MSNSYNKSKQDALFLKFILVKKSTCFRQIYLKHVEYFTKTNLRNSASHWLLLYKYIMMHGPLNVIFNEQCCLLLYIFLQHGFRTA
jgi:hypothetical protein